MNEMQNLLIDMVKQDHSLAGISNQTGIPVGRLMRCKNHGQDLKHKDACKLQIYAESLKVSKDDSASESE